MRLTPPTHLERIRAIAERVAQSSGLEVFDVQFRRESPGWVLRITIDRPEAGDAGAAGRSASAGAASVGIGDCERVSRDVGTILDVEEAIDRPYTLEVTSPGLDRPLRQAADYRRFAGRLARIVVSETIDGQRYFAGRLGGLEGETVVIVTEAGRTHRIPIGAIARARLDVEF